MTQSTISAYYAQDHDRLDELFKSFQKNKITNAAKAKKDFVEFKTGLERHIQWEEEILFPFFEEKTGMTEGGPTAVMRYEHRQIKANLELIKDKVHQGNPGSDAEEKNLLAVLGQHNAKEEQVLYPMIDQASDENDKKEIFKKMKELPLSSSRCCGGE